jgi:hypothetical protein
MDGYITAERRGRDSLRRFLLDLDAKEANEAEARSIGDVLELYLAVNAHPRNEEPLHSPNGGSVAPARAQRPSVPYGLTINEYSHAQLCAIVAWVQSDTLLRTEDQLLTETMRELGFHKRGKRIAEALTSAIKAQRSAREGRA